MHSYTAIKAADTTVLTYEEAKGQLNLTHDHQKDLVLAFIDAAVSDAENYTSRSLNIYNITVKSSGFVNALQLERTPLLNAAEVVIKYYDSAGDEQTLPSSDYEILYRNGEPEVHFKEFSDLPEFYDKLDAVSITYQSGYTSSNVPNGFKTYVRLVISFLYENRNDTVDKLPRFSKSFIRPFKKWLK